MTDEQYQKIVLDAKVLCDMTQNLQDRLYEMFLDDFLELDEIDENLHMPQQDFPF